MLIDLSRMLLLFFAGAFTYIIYHWDLVSCLKFSRPIEERIWISANASYQLQNEFKAFDVVEFTNLKKQDDESKQEIVDQLSKSIGIVMKNPIRIRKNRTEIRVHNFNVEASIKPKYIKKIYPNIYIHDLTNFSSDYIHALEDEQSSFIYTRNLFKILIKDKNKDVLNLVYNAALITKPDILYHHLIFPFVNIKDFACFVTSNDNYKDKDLWMELMIQLGRKCDDSIILIKIMQKVASSKKMNEELKLKLIPKVKQTLLMMHTRYYNEYTKELSKDWSNTRTFNQGSKRIIEGKLGRFLNFNDTKHSVEYYIFWEVFCQSVVDIMDYTVKKQLYPLAVRDGMPLALDVVNTYLMKSLRNQHDLHVMCSNCGLGTTMGDILRNSVKLDKSRKDRDLILRSIIKYVKH